MKRLLRTVLRAFAVAGVLSAVLAVRIVSASQAELHRAERLRMRDDLDGAILGYRRAARLYAPGNPYSKLALDRLAALARQAEDGRQLERALAAWRSVRGAILASRSFYVPHRERLEQAEDAIADLTATLSPYAERADARRQTREALVDPARPVLGWTVLALVGWLTWTGGVIVFTYRALDEEDRLLAPPALLWGTVIVAGFGCFALGLALA